ncbi:MAG: hypothetical protein AAB547_03415 [Patescibacteria group bacterium]
MPQTFYIDSDEEIISVIGRLRKSSVEENVFVFPKRALVLQSVVNLRLFQREAQKMGKKIVIVSQDEVGMMLAQKAGIETEKYSEDFSKQASHLELGTAEKAAAAVPAMAAQGALRSDAIGSSDFYSAHTLPQAIGGVSVPASAPVPSAGASLRVRNATPEKLTSLNSKRFEKTAISRDATSISSRTAQVASVSQAQTALSRPLLSEQKKPSEPARDERLKNFYSGTRKTSAVPVTKTKSQQMAVLITGKKAHMIFLILGGVSLLSLAGALLFFFLPKAEVHVTPYKITQTADIELEGRTDISAGEKTIPVRILEKEKEAVLTVVTTGKSGGTNQKARGTVVIYNNYSADSQPLVATTRLETPDGKLFRLVSGVTVPGMTSTGGAKDPGAIEADVIADQAGSEYNVDATTFTIPGFKGGPKYEKFSAKSTKAMIGGGSAGASDIAVVAGVDLDTAEREAKARAKEDFLNEIREELLPNEKILDEHIDIAALVPAAVPSVGTAANAFDYRGIFKVRAFVFSEQAVREKIENMVERDLGGIRFKPISSSITYSDSVPNFSDRILSLKAHALVTMESDIDRDMLREKLLGKNKDGIKQVLGGFPEVKKINVVFRPEWFVQSIPSSDTRVFILVEPGEEG